MPGLLWQDIVQASNFVVTPQLLVNNLQGLQRVVVPIQWLPFPFEVCGHEVLIGKVVRRDIGGGS